MTNWLARAKLEMSQTAGQVTANSDERNATAVMAVLHPSASENLPVSIGSNGSSQTAGFGEVEAVTTATILMTPEEERLILAWLAHIGEDDPASISDVLTQCRANFKERKILLGWARDVLGEVAFGNDRRRCDQCANLTERGLCLAARRGEINASRIYEPVRDLLQRCAAYLPKANDTDQRLGCERWPGLIYKETNHGNY